MRGCVMIAVTGVLGFAGATAHAGELHESIEALEPLLGTWEIEATWSHGDTLRGYAVYESVLNGRFVVGRTWVRDNGGPVYERYVTTYGAGAEPGVIATSSATFDGSMASASVETVETERGMSMRSEWSADPQGASVFAQSFTIDGEEARWLVKMASPGEPDVTMMDGTWRRVSDEALAYRGQLEGAPMTQPISDALFVGRGVDVDHYSVERAMGAPVERVYAAFADGDAFTRSYAPDRDELDANIELAIGGAYEWLWDGETGSNGCQVLSFVPNRMISFSWNAPPGHESRDLRTWVVVEFEESEGGTRVRLTHLGFGDEAHWQETKAYFQKAWPHVLDQFAKNLE
ncbi:MAG: SRPBCC domain-containing protein [Planctomycetota bacterium]